MALDVSGKPVAIKGSFTSVNQGQIKKALKALGARVTAIGKADMMFAGAKADFYIGAAERHGIPVHDEAALMALIQPVVEAPAPKAAPPPPRPEVPSAFTGLNVVLASGLATMNKPTAKRVLTEAGAKIQSKVNGQTDLVIHDRITPTTQMSDARHRGVPQMSEEAMVAELRRAGVGTAELADADAKLAKQDAKLMKKYGPALRAARKVHAPQIERWGLPLGSLLHAYIKAFAQRPDIHVRTRKTSGPATGTYLHIWHKKMPRWAHALYADIGETEFCWVFADQQAEMHSFSDGYRGGKLHIPSLYTFDWHKRPASWDAFTYEADAMVDRLQAEANTMLRYEPGEKRTEATLVFDDADDPRTFANWEAYLTLGAKRGFAWYWQNDDREGMGFVEKLFAQSLPRDTPADEVVAGLQGAGLTEAEARGIVAWLGEDAVVLLAR